MARGEKGKTDILIFVEDPGAVNGVVDLPEALKARGVRAQILAAGPAVEYLDSLGGDFQQPDPDAEPETILDQWAPKLVLAGTAENPDTLGLKLFAEAREVFPSGITHDARHLSPYGIYVARADGSRKWDVDGNEYVDYFGGHGALLLGHNPPEMVAAVQQ